ncbi:hypothetical protein JV16_00470 [Anoxybacillus ayderensis]|uniref:Uncharacterized protein n=1 Tax=Anoxybacillus ayderensis TaxID=265546 RepID=A0A0D0HP97_9BACL|nr:hypothetical protein JV16_00470 [Anoxybacillus ayderensis]
MYIFRNLFSTVSIEQKMQLRRNMLSEQRRYVLKYKKRKFKSKRQQVRLFFNMKVHLEELGIFQFLSKGMG